MSAQPNPKVWPECGTCGTAWVLRRAFLFGDDDQKWIWQRDCRHKSKPELAGDPARAGGPTPEESGRG